MCTVSMIMDHYGDKWGELAKPIRPIQHVCPPQIPQAEIDEFRKLLERARDYDKKHNEPDCELAEKKTRVLKLAEELGVKIEFL